MESSQNKLAYICLFLLFHFHRCKSRESGKRKAKKSKCCISYPVGCGYMSKNILNRAGIYGV
jgi:hypothetical protein